MRKVKCQNRPLQASNTDLKQSCGKKKKNFPLCASFYSYSKKKKKKTFKEHRKGKYEYWFCRLYEDFIVPYGTNIGCVEVEKAAVFISLSVLLQRPERLSPVRGVVPLNPSPALM